MKFTQEQKETIFNNYMSFVNSLADDLDFKTDISPKEIVYAVLGLVEYELNSPPQGNCSSCNQGDIKEMSIYDDWEGMLTCNQCGVRVKK